MSLIPQAPGGSALVMAGAPSGHEGSSRGQRGTAEGLRSSLAALQREGLQHKGAASALSAPQRQHWTRLRATLCPPLSAGRKAWVQTEAQKAHNLAPNHPVKPLGPLSRPG